MPFGLDLRDNSDYRELLAIRRERRQEREAEERARQRAAQQAARRQRQQELQQQRQALTNHYESLLQDYTSQFSAMLSGSATKPYPALMTLAALEPKQLSQSVLSQAKAAIHARDIAALKDALKLSGQSDYRRQLTYLRESRAIRLKWANLKREHLFIKIIEEAFVKFAREKHRTAAFTVDTELQDAQINKLNDNVRTKLEGYLGLGKSSQNLEDSNKLEKKSEDDESNSREHLVDLVKTWGLDEYYTQVMLDKINARMRSFLQTGRVKAPSNKLAEGLYRLGKRLTALEQECDTLQAKQAQLNADFNSHFNKVPKAVTDKDDTADDEKQAPDNLSVSASIPEVAVAMFVDNNDDNKTKANSLLDEALISYQQARSLEDEQAIKKSTAIFELLLEYGFQFVELPDTLDWTLLTLLLPRIDSPSLFGNRLIEILNEYCRETLAVVSSMTKSLFTNDSITADRRQHIIKLINLHGISTEPTEIDNSLLSTIHTYQCHAKTGGLGRSKLGAKIAELFKEIKIGQQPVPSSIQQLAAQKRIEMSAVPNNKALPSTQSSYPRRFIGAGPTRAAQLRLTSGVDDTNKAEEKAAPSNSPR